MESSLEELLRLGQIGLDLGYYAEAEAYFDRALALNPDHPRALVGKARACQNVELALEIVREALIHAPDDAEAQSLRQELLAQPPSPLYAGDPGAVEGEDRYILSASPVADDRPLEAEMPLTEGRPEDAFSRRLSPRTVTITLGIAVAALLVTLGIAGYQMIRPQAVYTLQPDIPPTAEPTLITNPLPAISTDGKVDLLLDAQAACVFVVVPSASSPEARRGSGSVITSDGLVLTNYHVLTDENLVLVNSRGLAFVGFTDDARYPPSRWYIAALVNGDIVRDLAILRIVATAKGTPVRDLSFPIMPLGDSDALQLGQPLVGLGYPALGGKTLTLTKGVMGGFDAEGQVRLGKTDSELLPGSSGGAVLDEKGRLVGIIREIYTDYRTQGRLSYFVLFSEARSLIREAQYAGYPRVELDWMIALAPQLFR